MSVKLSRAPVLKEATNDRYAKDTPRRFSLRRWKKIIREAHFRAEFAQGAWEHARPAPIHSIVERRRVRGILHAVFRPSRSA
jgi:hypothetical protein